MSSSCHAAALWGTPILPRGGSRIGGGLDRQALTTAEAETVWGSAPRISEEGTSELRSKGHGDRDIGWGSAWPHRWGSWSHGRAVAGTECRAVFKSVHPSPPGNSSGSSNNEWLNKMPAMLVGEYYLALKRDGVPPYVTVRMGLE